MATGKISQFRQTSKLRVKIKGGEIRDVVLRLANEDPNGKNSCPVGESVYLDGEWHRSSDVAVLQVLTW